MIEQEIWRGIEDSDGHYYISNLGRMRRDAYEFRSKKNALIHHDVKIWNEGNHNKGNGYYYYRYRAKNGTSNRQSVHRLVALAFVKNPNPNIFEEVNHIDGNKSNNRADNLEWCNRKLNMEHASKHDLINRDSEKRKAQAPINGRIGAEKACLPRAAYNKEGNLVKIDKSGVDTGTSAICRLTYKGLTYRFCHILIDQYGEIPSKIDAQRSFNAATNTRKKYIETKPDGTINEYIKIEDLPISRDKLWFCFNHGVADQNGSSWDIQPLDMSTLPKKEAKGVKTLALDDEGNVCMTFKSVKEMKQIMGVTGLNTFYEAVRKHKKYKGYYWETIHD